MTTTSTTETPVAAPNSWARAFLLAFALIVGLIAVGLVYSPSLRMQAISAITGEPHYEDKFASTWMKDIKSDSPRIRQDSAEALGQIVPTSPEIAVALTEAMDDNIEEVRIAAAESLGNIGVQDGPAIVALTKALKDPSPFVRLTAAHSLTNTGLTDPAVVEGLLVTLNDRDRGVRAAAAEGLAALDSVSIPILIKSLDGNNIRVRREAVYALGLAGGSSQDAMPKIISLISEGKHPSVRRAAVVASVEIDPEDKALKPALLKSLDDKDVLVRVAAVEAIEKMEAHDEEVITKFVDILQDEEADSMVREFVAQALGAMGPNAKSAVPALTALVAATEDDPGLHGAAEDAVDQINAVAVEEK